MINKLLLEVTKSSGDFIKVYLRNDKTIRVFQFVNQKKLALTQLFKFGKDRNVVIYDETKRECEDEKLQL